VLISQGNLLNRHSHKYSGLANSKVISILPTAEGSIAITKVKADAKPNQVCGRFRIRIRSLRDGVDDCAS
jgi:hypothetical protein